MNSLLLSPAIRRPWGPGQHLASKGLQMPEVSPSILSGRDMQNQRSKHAVMKLIFQLACIIFAEIAVIGPS